MNQMQDSTPAESLTPLYPPGSFMKYPSEDNAEIPNTYESLDRATSFGSKFSAQIGETKDWSNPDFYPQDEDTHSHSSQDGDDETTADHEPLEKMLPDPATPEETMAISLHDSTPHSLRMSTDQDGLSQNHIKASNNPNFEGVPTIPAPTTRIKRQLEPELQPNPSSDVKAEIKDTGSKRPKLAEKRPQASSEQDSKSPRPHYNYRSRDKMTNINPHNGTFARIIPQGESQKRIRCTWNAEETRRLLQILSEDQQQELPDVSILREELLKMDPNTNKSLEHVRNKKANLIQKARAKGVTVADILRDDLMKMESGYYDHHHRHHSDSSHHTTRAHRDPFSPHNDSMTTAGTMSHSYSGYSPRSPTNRRNAPPSGLTIHIPAPTISGITTATALPFSNSHYLSESYPTTRASVAAAQAAAAQQNYHVQSTGTSAPITQSSNLQASTPSMEITTSPRLSSKSKRKPRKPSVDDYNDVVPLHPNSDSTNLKLSSFIHSAASLKQPSSTSILELANPHLAPPLAHPTIQEHFIPYLNSHLDYLHKMVHLLTAEVRRLSQTQPCAFDYPHSEQSSGVSTIDPEDTESEDMSTEFNHGDQVLLTTQGDQVLPLHPLIDASGRDSPAVENPSF